MCKEIGCVREKNENGSVCEKNVYMQERVCV